MKAPLRADPAGPGPSTRGGTGDARVTAVDLLVACERRPGSLEGELERLRAAGPAAPGDRDRRFVRQLAVGVVKWRSRLDWVLERFSSRPVAAMDAEARQILRLGAFQLLFLDRVPPHAAVHSSVELAKHFGHRGVAGMVNAVLRKVKDQGCDLTGPDRSADEAGYLATWYSHPVWLVSRWLARWGAAHTEALLKTNNEPGRVWVRHHPGRVDAVALASALGLEGDVSSTSPPPGDALPVADPAGLFETPAFRDGWFFAQDRNAGLPAALLDPRPGQWVLDLCSAPGGKAIQAALSVGTDGRVVAADLSPARLRLVQENRRRLGLTQLLAVAEDGIAAAADGRSSGRFDRVLVDAPCTGTGVLARHPEARWLRCAGEPVTPGR